jgi:hypothetical protein
MQADALKIGAGAKRRLADEYDAARGSAARRSGRMAAREKLVPAGSAIAPSPRAGL